MFTISGVTSVATNSKYSAKNIQTMIQENEIKQSEKSDNFKSKYTNVEKHSDVKKNLLTTLIASTGIFVACKNWKPLLKGLIKLPSLPNKIYNTAEGAVKKSYKTITNVFKKTV